MNKELLISIKPEHLVNILNGKKTLELRKTVPKDFKGWVYLYCTKSKPYYEPRINGITNQKMWNIHNDFIYHTDINGKVVARFWFDEFAELNPNNIFGENLIDYEQYDNRYPDEYIEQSGVIDTKFLEELTQVSLEDMQKYSKGKYIYAWHIKKLEIFDTPLSLSDFNIKRPPQSYQFVYEKEELR